MAEEAAEPKVVDTSVGLNEAIADQQQFDQLLEQAQAELATEAGEEAETETEAAPAEAKPAAKAKKAETTDDEALPDLEEAKTQSDDEEEELPELTKKPPERISKRLRLKSQREDLEQQFAEQKQRLEQQISELREEVKAESALTRRMKQAAEEGRLDDLVKEVGFDNFSAAQKRYLEGKGALAKSEAKLPPALAKEIEELRTFKRELEEQREQEREQYTRIQQQQAEQQELESVLEAMSASKYREVKAINGGDEDVKHRFANMVRASIRLNPDEESDAYHFRVALNGLKTAYEKLSPIFGERPSATESRGPNGHPSSRGAKNGVAPSTKKTEAPAKGLPGQPGDSAENGAQAPTTLSQSQSTEARGGKTKYDPTNDQDDFNRLIAPYVHR